MAKDINQLICDYLDGRITESEQKVLYEYLATHKEADQRFRRLAEQKDLAARYREYAAVDTHKALQQFMEKQELMTPVNHEFRLKSLFSPFKCVAATLLLLLAGGAYWYAQYTKVTPPEIPEAVQVAMQQSIQSGKADAVVEERLEELRIDHKESPTPHPSLTKEQLLAARRITVRHDKEFWLTLDDGTLVHMNYDTRLVYPEHFGRDDRNVVLDGEAYFMVAQDKSRPFVVHTANGDIKVYGTEFNVNTRGEASSAHGEKETSVILVKGAISVRPNGGGEQMLKPSQKLSIIPSLAGSYQLSVSDVDVTPYIAWNTGEFAFSDAPLDVILSTMRHWYHIDIHLANPEAGKMLFTGTIDRYGAPSTILKSISKVTGLTVNQEGNRYTIK